MIKVYVYYKNGNVDVYEVANEWKAREHAEKIWISGYRQMIGSRMEWFGSHWIDKICWDVVNKDFMNSKYESGTVKEE
jgi:hypothetical protein